MILSALIQALDGRETEVIDQAQFAALGVDTINDSLPSTTRLWWNSPRRFGLG